MVEDKETENASSIQFKGILNGLRTRVRSIMGLSDEDFTMEVASAGPDVVVRICHKRVLVNGQDWMAIVGITTKWKSSRFERVEFSDTTREIWPIYKAQVKIAHSLGMFREDIKPIIHTTEDDIPLYTLAT